MRGVPSARQTLVFSLAFLLLVGLVTPARARPLVLEDLQRREGLGAASVDPQQRWLVVERRGPYRSAFRFDFDSFVDVARTHLELLDLMHPTRLRPLFKVTPRTGYAVGPFSPDGRQVAVFRLTDDHWELGVATPASRTVRWLGIYPELASFSRPVQWMSQTDLAVVAKPDRVLPFHMRIRRTEALLQPTRWRTSALGGSAQTMVGAGRWLDFRPQPTPRRVFRVDAVTGHRTPLAVGQYVDLEASVDGSWLALIEAGGDNPMRLGQPIQDVYGFAFLSHRLRILDLKSLLIRTPCPACDVTSGTLSWSPKGDALLVYARQVGEPWTAGHLYRVSAPGGAMTPVGDGDVVPRLQLRPERVFAAWLGDSPVVWGVPEGDPVGTRPDWYRIGDTGSTRLTADIPTAASRATTEPGGMIVTARGAAWWLSGSHAKQVFDHIAAGEPASATADPRDPYATPHDRPWFRLMGGVDGAQVAMIDTDGRPSKVDAPGASEVLAAAPRRAGALVRTHIVGGEERLEWVTAGQHPIVLATINRHLADIDPVRFRAVQHAGPDGERLTSYVLLPAKRSGRPPPLVVWPYLDHDYTRPPPDLTDPTFNEMTALLVGHGYAVLLPSLPWTWTSGPEPAEGLADKLLTIVDAAAKDPNLAGAFDPDRLGIWGHSFGGWSTLMTITQTHRFKAAIAAASMSDLPSLWGQFQGIWSVDPTEGLGTFNMGGWTEDLQAGMHAPPFVDPARYLRNSPIFHAGAVTTPLLLLHGDQDAFGVGQAHEMFSALLRQNKDAEVVTYWGEGHLIRSPGNQRDMYRRVFAWFDTYLNGAPVTKEPSARSRSPAPDPANSEPKTPQSLR